MSLGIKIDRLENLLSKNFMQKHKEATPLENTIFPLSLRKRQRKSHLILNEEKSLLFAEKNHSQSYLSQKFHQSRRSNKSLRKANEQIRNLTQSKRIQISQQIKNQQTCFKLRLKLLSILRIICSSSQNLAQYEMMGVQEFVSGFQKKIKDYIKSAEHNLMKNKQAIRQIEKKIVQKSYQVNDLKAYNEQQEIHFQKMKDHSRKECQHYKLIIQSKDSKIMELTEKLSQIEQKKTEKNEIKFCKTAHTQSSFQCLPKYMAIDQCRINQASPLKNQQLSQPKQSIKNKLQQEQYISNNEMKQKLMRVVSEWRQVLYRTVRHYENIIQKNHKELIKKQDQLRRHKRIVNIQ